jgi:Spy/CpxP family protein refolding chaperone
MQAGGGMTIPSGEMGMMKMMGDMSMMDQMMGGMTMEGGMMSMAPHSALPGFPGASHIYHIGATGFFLDHAQHIGLSTEQQVSLNKIKEQTLLAKSATDRQIAQAEQELAVLTSSDQPDLKKIENKIREIVKLAADERIAFIKAVGEAAKLLTDQQRKILTGFATPAASPMPSMSPMEHM